MYASGHKGMYHPPDYIDNIIADRQLREVLRCLLTEWGERELAIASGYFEPEVWRMLGATIRSLCAFIAVTFCTRRHISRRTSASLAAATSRRQAVRIL